MSSTTLTGFIQACGIFVEESLAHKQQISPFISITADQCTDIAVVEELSLCTKYLDNIGMVPEEILLMRCGQVHLMNEAFLKILNILSKTLQSPSQNVCKVTSIVDSITSQLNSLIDNTAWLTKAGYRIRSGELSQEHLTFKVMTSSEIKPHHTSVHCWNTSRADYWKVTASFVASHSSTQMNGMIYIYIYMIVAIRSLISYC